MMARRMGRARRLFRGLSSLPAQGIQDGGRACPLSYRTGTASLANPEHDILLDESCSVFVVGGLYGNLCALSAIEERIAREKGEVRCVFNGDFNFFNASLDDFEAVNRTIRDGHLAIAGNVEIEASDHLGTSCGCAYPAYVPDEVVHRSNSIVGRLRQVAQRADPELLGWLKSLPKTSVIRLGEARIGVIHGDPETLAGWAFSVERIEPLDEELRRSLGCGSVDAQMEEVTPDSAIESFFDCAEVDVFACTHTCLPWAQAFRDRVVINNGSSGMPNFDGTQFGLMSRIAAADLPPPPDSLYGWVGRSLRVDAIPIHYCPDDWGNRFLHMHPMGSAAHTSYWERICRGVQDFRVQQAARRGFEVMGR